jgi:gamma-glutamyltranspeptidase/glutathione hydrolase
MSILCAVLLSACTLVLPGDRITGRAFATRSEVISKHCMAATSQPLATQVALEIMRDGGSAVDAAIAANAMLAFLEPTGSGLGGDLFAIVWDASTQRLYGLNASGRSPRALTLEEFAKKGITKIPERGPLPVTVPGCVDGWFELHERFGKLAMRDVLAPAIAQAREGAPVSELIAWYWAKGAEKLASYPGFVETFLPAGHPPAKGEIFANPRLASSLERIAEGGRDAFYRGDMARTIASAVQAQGGYLAYEDLAEHHSEWVEPLSVDYRGYRVWELPPNGQGITALQMLTILEGYDIGKLGFASPDWVHLFVEAKKLAFEDRARFCADPAFEKIPVAELLSKEYAAERRTHIDLARAAKSYPPGNPALEHGDTVYLCVADEHGNMVSLIQSNFRGMGSGVTPADLGFVLQDRGELFDLTPGRPNSYAPGKRPFHTIIPAFVTKDDRPFLCFGVMGGDTQPQMHVQILVDVIDFGMNLQEAGDAPRILHSGSSQPTGERMENGGEVSLESGFPLETVRELLMRGHDVGWNHGEYGGYQAIGWDAEHGVWIGASDSRKDGQAAGY